VPVVGRQKLKKKTKTTTPKTKKKQKIFAASYVCLRFLWSLSLTARRRVVFIYPDELAHMRIHRSLHPRSWILLVSQGIATI